MNSLRASLLLILIVVWIWLSSYYIIYFEFPYWVDRINFWTSLAVAFWITESSLLKKDFIQFLKTKIFRGRE